MMSLRRYRACPLHSWCRALLLMWAHLWSSTTGLLQPNIWALNPSNHPWWIIILFCFITAVFYSKLSLSWFVIRSSWVLNWFRTAHVIVMRGFNGVFHTWASFGRFCGGLGELLLLCLNFNFILCFIILYKLLENRRFLQLLLFFLLNSSNWLRSNRILPFDTTHIGLTNSMMILTCNTILLRLRLIIRHIFIVELNWLLLYFGVVRHSWLWGLIRILIGFYSLSWVGQILWI